ncbi:MAG: transposase [Deltaproteobacteria bacterium]|nr:transposase [Deltaproteobacteria bacterium]
MALSCRGRGFCQSCLGRRMVARAAHLVDRVLPVVPVRHWVLSLPFALRYRLAWDHELCRAVLGIFARALMAFTRRRARCDPTTARTGAVTVIQRAGSAANLNIHFHTIAVDGAFVEGRGGRLSFRPVRAPSPDEVSSLLAIVRTRILALLARRGLVVAETGDPTGDFDLDPPPLAEVYAASVRQRLATGERAGREPMRLRSAAFATKREDPDHRGARQDGFDLCASRAVRANNRSRLERLCRYLLRPPIPAERLSEEQGLVLLALPRPWTDGSTHVAFEPAELIERLAALVPRPHANLILYHGVLAGHARWRSMVVRFGRGREPVDGRPSRGESSRNPTWAELMRRGMDLDVLACPRCGSRMRHIATILGREVIHKVLVHLGLDTDPDAQPPHSARAPPAPASALAPGRSVPEIGITAVAPIGRFTARLARLAGPAADSKVLTSEPPSAPSR